jgi:hypothetical protein
LSGLPITAQHELGRPDAPPLIIDHETGGLPVTDAARPINHYIGQYQQLRKSPRGATRRALTEPFRELAIWVR